MPLSSTWLFSFVVILKTNINFAPSLYHKIFFSTFWSEGIFIARHLQKHFHYYTTMIITFVIIFTILAAFRVIVKEVLSQGFFPSNSEETRRLFYRRQFVCSSFTWRSRNQRDIRNNHRRPSCSPDASLNRDAWVSGVRGWVKCSKRNRK